MTSLPTTLLAAFVLLAPGCAHALSGDRYTLGAGATLTYDDNLYRLPDGVSPPSSTGSTRRSDFVTALSVRGQANLAVRRQRLRLDATGIASTYREHDTLDNRGGNASLAWDWQASSWWTGSLAAARSQSISSFVDLRTFEKNRTDVQTLSGSVEHWVLADWRIGGGVVSQTVDNSAASLAAARQDNLAWNAGVRWTSGPDNSIRAVIVLTDGRSPNVEVLPGAVVDNRFRQTETGLEANWRFSGRSELSGRIAYTVREHPQVSQRDFSGVTGRLQWDWRAGGKSGIAVLGRREIGAVTDLVSNYVITEAASIGPYLLPTAKTRIELSLERQRRVFAGDPGIVLSSEPAREDRLAFASLSLRYLPSRTSTLGATLSRSTRESNRPGFQFRDSSLALTAQVAW